MGHIDVTTLFNKEGYSALTFAASQSKISACYAIVGFIRRKQEEANSDMDLSSSGVSGASSQAR